MVRVLVLAILVLGPWLARADEDAMAKYRDFLPQQLMDLPESARSSDVPMAYTGAANLALSPGGDLVFQMHLNDLMYNGMGDFEGAKTEYQRDLGEKPTGNLTVWQIFQLGYRADRQKLGSVAFFPLGFSSGIYETFAIVQGTVSILDERIAYPINHVKIKCDKNRGVCDYRQIALMFPDENSWTQSYTVMEIADDTYRITRWENEQIDAIPFDTTTCRINQLSLNFSTSEFYEIARNNKEKCELVLGGTLPPLEKPRVSQILDGTKIIYDEFQKVREEAFGYTAKSFQARVQELRRILEAQKDAR